MSMQQMAKQVRRAFTLIEMLIAMALTLILVYAIAEFYAYIGTHVRDGRALIEMGGQLRSAAQQLHDDLNSLTLRPEPWIDPTSSPGYFTVYEGPYTDAYPDGATDISSDTNTNQIPDAIENLNITNLIGDGDDLLAMTIRATNVPFQGQVWDTSQSPARYVSVTSQYAEVIWYTSFTDLDGDNIWDINEPRFLCRRQLLILPTLGVLQMPGAFNLAAFFQQAEVSFHLNTSGQPVANSLADLSLRHNRYGCQAQNPIYPSHMRLNPTYSPSVQSFSLGDDTANSPPLYTRFGEDRVLPNLLAFDVRVFDPAAPIYQDPTGTSALAPGDVGYRQFLSTNSSASPVGLGAWVDLSYNRSSGPGSSHFSGPSMGRGLPSGAANPANSPSAVPFNLSQPSSSNLANEPYNFHQWDTWAHTYELTNFGYPANQNNPARFANRFPGTGRAFNGQDDPPTGGQYGVDDATERETEPPYASPLRGIQVRVRIYEPQTRQMRQVTVGADFVAE